MIDGRLRLDTERPQDNVVPVAARALSAELQHNATRCTPRLIPLASHRSAEFLHNEVPGMTHPGEYRERMAKVGGGPPA